MRLQKSRKPETAGFSYSMQWIPRSRRRLEVACCIVWQIVNRKKHRFYSVALFAAVGRDISINTV